MSIRKAIGIVLGGVSVVSLALPSVGQQMTPHRQLTRHAFYPFSTTAFTGVVHPHFQGNNLQKILTDLSEGYVDRGEFETKYQYDRRMDTVNLGPLADGIPRDSSVAFVFPTEDSLRTMPEGSQTVDAVYDADRGSLAISVWMEPKHRESSEDDAGNLEIMWNKNVHSSSTYAGSNAYGASVAVTKTTSISNGITFKKLQGAPQSHPLVLTVPMQPDKARRIEHRLRVLVICKIRGMTPPSETTIYHPATFDVPIEDQSTYRYLDVIPSDFWIFDSVTGEVVAQFKVDAHPTSASEITRPAAAWGMGDMGFE